MVVHIVLIVTIPHAASCQRNQVVRLKILLDVRIGMLFTERGIITEDLPMQNTSQFMFTPTSLDALLLSMQYQSLMGNLTRLSPPK